MHCGTIDKLTHNESNCDRIKLLNYIGLRFVVPFHLLLEFGTTIHDMQTLVSRNTDFSHLGVNDALGK